MKKLSLSGKWRMTGAGFDCVGTVPGSMYSFLLENKLIDDPFFRDNEYDALKYSLEEFSFERTFEYDEEGAAALLRFEGLDTFCDVYLNGKHIAATDNMHVTYEFDVTGEIKKGENTVRVDCHPVYEYCQK